MQHECRHTRQKGLAGGRHHRLQRSTPTSVCLAARAPWDSEMTTALVGVEGLAGWWSRVEYRQRRYWFGELASL
jgi:hypothetical protein